MAVAFIPVRGGSKSIPLKNIKSFCGKPLVYWCAKALQDSQSISRIVIATDSDEIKKTVNTFGFSKLEVYDREPQNAADTSSTEDVMLEYLHKGLASADDLFLLVQATNPFITTEDIESAIEQMSAENADSLLTCVRYKRFFWNEDGTPINYDYRNRPRRQDFKGELMENGAFYISKVKNVLEDSNRLSGKIAVYEMPEYTAFEIDEPDDWVIMEKLFGKYILKQTTTRPLKPVKLFLSDVDGVLTDAGMYYTESGDELKKFNTHDGMGFNLLRQCGIKTGIITTENTQMVTRRAKKLNLDYVHQGKGFGSKLDIALEICKLEGIGIDEVAYIGDDINCIDLLGAVGVKACPTNATHRVKAIPGILQLNTKGGDGAVREFVEWLFANSFCTAPEPVELKKDKWAS
ncbi:acylneuraminate cytidylyltransferase [Mucilaginibacter hurinus]|uniref:N-acylneuraminate cytidylyltransferase n=1 Tax=Mucilaginibacter hurinus TaxID=2201324 RepID=A0A367GT90_9SPHI|nr:acylneuraminate cytidylyltransferase [Mucilaginibacter hurinus]RCH56652.1 acylneuraminate cytidylyltransferase [Mucilaginibacter hurinus]